MDARIVKTKQKIKDTLMLLLQSKRISEVTISELCKKANINRNTFYAHYSTPEQVLDEVANDLQEGLYSVLNDSSTSEQTLIAACKYTKDNAKNNIILLDNNAESIFVKKGIDHSINSRIYVVDNQNGRFSEKQIKLIHEYITIGAVAIMKSWLYSGMKESPEEIGKLIDFINSSLVAGLNSAK